MVSSALYATKSATLFPLLSSRSRYDGGEHRIGGAKVKDSQRMTTWIDLWIVVAALVTVVLITLIVTGAYRDAAEAGTVLGVIFPSAVAIASAAFGVTQALKTGEAQRQTDSAKEQARTLRNKSAEALGLLRTVDPAKAYSLLQRLGSSPAGDARLTIQQDGAAEVLNLDDIVSESVRFQ